MTLPRTLQLVETPQGLKLAQKPVDVSAYASKEWDPDQPFLLHLKEEGPFRITLSNEEESVSFGLDAQNHLFMDRRGLKKASWSDQYDKEAYAFCRAERFFDGACDFTLIVDHSVAEIYADGGTRVGTMLLYPAAPLTNCEVRHNR